MKLLNHTNIKAFAKNVGQKRTSTEFLDQLNDEVKRMVKRACRNATKKHTRPQKTIHAVDLRWDWA